MLCPSCQKSQPLSFRCGSCGAPMMQATYPTTMAPVFDDAFSPIPVADNPYRTPKRSVTLQPSPTDVATDVLASRGARLAAAIIDYLCMLAVAIPGLAGFFYAEMANAGAPTPQIASLVFVLGLGLLGLAQATYIVRDGQTIGKKMMKIKIVGHVDGRVPPWPRVLGIRYLANMALCQLPFYYFADALFIFGKDQRCIHDYLAGTKVVEV